MHLNKTQTASAGPNDDTLIPKDSTKLDYEVDSRPQDGETAQLPR